MALTSSCTPSAKLEGTRVSSFDKLFPWYHTSYETTTRMFSVPGMRHSSMCSLAIARASFPHASGASPCEATSKPNSDIASRTKKKPKFVRPIRFTTSSNASTATISSRPSAPSAHCCSAATSGRQKRERNSASNFSLPAARVPCNCAMLARSVHAAASEKPSTATKRGMAACKNVRNLVASPVTSNDQATFANSWMPNSWASILSSAAPSTASESFALVKPRTA
mmetsp:Transcript_51020/g.131684  ORF Transcript_51020/g.131684 Transcript_51020/m.131684 type:complete len:225 (-) Transcript_51020:423-1097(-)